MSVEQMLVQIRNVNPNFNPKTSSLRGIMSALHAGVGMKVYDLQNALNGLGLQDAMRYRAALQILVNDNPQVCYLNVQSFTYQTMPSTMPGMSFATDPTPANRRIRYTSAKMDVHSTVYVIAPATTHHEVGFIQHCTAKSDESRYSDGSGMKDDCRLAFPIGDAPSHASHHPWYCKGQSDKCTQPTWVDLMGRDSGTVNLQMNDWFDNNFHPYHPYTPVGMNVMNRLQSIQRKQSFKLWLVHERPGALKRLLRELTYTINVSVTVNAMGAITGFTSNVSDIRERTPSSGEMLPQCSAPSMNNQSIWKYKSTANGIWGASALQ